eukprot:366030-Chlamydomonas_euryale.AAC.2
MVERAVSGHAQHTRAFMCGSWGLVWCRLACTAGNAFLKEEHLGGCTVPMTTTKHVQSPSPP